MPVRFVNAKVKIDDKEKVMGYQIPVYWKKDSETFVKKIIADYNKTAKSKINLLRLI